MEGYYYGTGTSGMGVFGDAPNDGYGVYGEAGNGFGGYVTSPGTGTAGTNAALYGNATGTGSTGTGVLGSGFGYGVYGTSNGGYGVYGHATGSSGDAIHGVASNTWSAVAGVNGSTGPGVYGSSTGGYGVYGIDLGTGGSGYGVYGTSAYDVGVYGISSATYGVGVWGKCTGASCNAGYFTGNVYATGSITQNSDSRLKNNIKPLVGAMEQLLQLKGVTFEWNEPDKHGDQTGTQRGFIAQDVEKVFPGWVGVDKDGFKTLSVQQVEALEVESIRTLKMQNDVLTERLAALERGRQVRISGINLDGVGFGVGGIAIAVAVFFGLRQRRDDKREAARP